MGIVRTEGVILRTYPFSETSKVVHSYTIDYGPQSLMARGARRPKSKFGGLLETFTRLELLYFKKDSSSLYTLTECSLIEAFPGMPFDLSRFYAGSVCLELVKRFILPEESSRELYHLLTSSLRAISTSDHDRTEFALFFFVWRFITLLGFKPDFQSCVSCGKAMKTPSSLVIYEMAIGACCEHCSSTLSATRTIDWEYGELIESITGEGKDTLIRQQGPLPMEVWNFTTLYIKSHLFHERDLSTFNTFLAYVHSVAQNNIQVRGEKG